MDGVMMMKMSIMGSFNYFGMTLFTQLRN